MHKQFSIFCPVIPYHFTLSTGLERDASTTARVYVIIIGHGDTETERLWLDLPEGKKSFAAGSMEHFVCYGADVGEIKRVEVRIWERESVAKSAKLVPRCCLFRCADSKTNK